MNNKKGSQRVARSLHAHQIVALALGALIYILSVTGTLSVFNRELQRWEQPDAPEMQAISPQAAAIAAKTVFESEPEPTTHLFINFPQADLPRTVVTTDTQAFFVRADGTVAQKEDFPWTQFLLDLHYYLHLPQILGLIVVGALGAFLLAMSISGFMAHPRIFRDAFTFRRGRGLLPLTDLHNRLSVWTAPFHISNALTGALLGLASILAFLIAAVNFDGDVEKVFAPVFGEEPPIIEGEAPLASIEGPLKFMQEEFPNRPLTYFILHDPATAGQHVNVIAKHEDRLIFGEYYNFDANGQYTGNVGISDGTIGQQIIGSVYNIHFGNWGGLPVKLAYGVFGIVLSIIIVSGLRMYFLRRRQKGDPAPRLEAAWEGITWGTISSLLFTFLTSLWFGFSGLSLVATFWLLMVLTPAAAALLADHARTNRLLRSVNAACLLLVIVSYTVSNFSSVTSFSSLSVLSVLVVCLILIFGSLASKKYVSNLT